MMPFNEGRVDPITNNLVKNNLNKVIKTTDSAEEINGANAVIDISPITKLSDAAFIKAFRTECFKFRGYSGRKAVYINIDEWKCPPNILEGNNTISALCRYIKSTPNAFKKDFADFEFYFINNKKEVLPLIVNDYQASEFPKFMQLLTAIKGEGKAISNTSRPNAAIATSSAAVSPVKNIAKDEKKEVKEKLKNDLIDKIETAAEESETEDEALDKLDTDQFKNILAALEDDPDEGPKLSATRSARMNTLNKQFLDSKVGNKSVKELLDKKDVDIEVSHLKINSINEEEWDNVKFINFQKSYDLNSDIVKILYDFTNKDYPISVRNVAVEDTSTVMDALYTYTVDMEDAYGKRFKLTFDIPKFRSDRFMKLRGNEKIMQGQLMLLPCLKTDEDTVQVVSNYNKIFVRRYGRVGRSYPSSDRLVKALNKFHGKQGIKIFYGDMSQVCTKYELPVDYIDVACSINKIETKEAIYFFNQDIYRKEYKLDPSQGIPYGIYKKDGSILYYDYEKAQMPISMVIAISISNEYHEFADIYNAIKPATKLNYSMASMMSAKIPLVVVLGYSMGLSKLAKKMGIKFTDVDNRSSIDYDKFGVIKFSDRKVLYPITYASSMMFNGLAECDTMNYEARDMDSRNMWLDFLDEFGGRIISDGLDNFRELMMDPITREVCEDFKIPSDYEGILIYANNLLADNKFNRHTDITGNRFRTNEQVAKFFYSAICNSYSEYKLNLKRGRKNAAMTMKRSIVIDNILTNSTTSDLSILNPVLELESANTVTFKGPSGMNSSRAYSLDKRTYDDSMINKLALSTGFAANVGISRQTTIDMDIQGKRGYIKKSNEDEMGVTKSLSVSEAITPFGVTSDDPFRSAMTFIQTAKHSMRTKSSAPLLITNGTDEAMVYMASDTYCFKARADGQVLEIVPDKYMLVQYKNGTSDYVSLKEEIKKNSDGGFYITIKLDTDLKAGSKVKQNDIIAYDKSSFSNKVGEDDSLAYNLGILTKVAILNTDEGFEDSTIIDNWLSEAMASEVSELKDVTLSPNTNIYNLVKVGDKVEEGDPLIIYQNSFDEKDVNALLKTITDPDLVSDLGRIRLKAKHTGIVKDIKMYRTCDIEDMSESLQKVFRAYERDIKATKAMYKKYKIPGINELEPDYKLPQTGKLKDVRNGVYIEIYLTYNDKMSVGDKLVAQSANKGVVKDIIAPGNEPFTKANPEEKIHALFAARSFNARMVTSPWKSGGINKGLIELDRKVKEIMGLPRKSIEEINDA